MEKMKTKLLTITMAVMMALGSLSITAGAATANAGTSSVDITKTLTATGLEDTTFYFTVEEYDVTDAASGITKYTMPEIDDFSITVSEGETTGTYTITLPEYESVGVYIYKISETPGTTAGVTYDTNELYLVVTVTLESGVLTRYAAIHVGSVSGTKNNTEVFTNKYEAGTLAVTKSVTGNMGDTTKSFHVTVTFTKDSTINSTISYEVDGTTYEITPDMWTSDTYSVDFYVTDGTTVTFKNIPYGVTYEVVEDDYYNNGDGYTTTYSGSDGTDGKGTVSGTDTVTIINNKENNTPDTGVILDSLPYILILAVVLVGAVFVIFRRRSTDID
ncbi:MAG: hypothetical protein LIP12_08495 [Clostridiales bacterium]|nr:hypothetical protein [Clostridiales bacterium]